MKKKIIWSHTIVHNEENFIWFALMSAVDFVDKMIVWDSGSTDNTVRIIEEVKRIKPDKIEFKQVGDVDENEFTRMRQSMLDQSDCDWILILDGDEVWWKDSLKKITDFINQKMSCGIVVSIKIPVGDIYHFQDESAGRYTILGKTGHLNLKVISKNISGLHLDCPYGKEGFFDKDNKLIQDRDDIIFLDAQLLHLTHLKRSSQKRKYNKVKYEIGSRVPIDFKFPEVFYEKYPEIVPSPWVKMNKVEFIKASILTPLRKIKRKLNG